MKHIFYTYIYLDPRKKGPYTYGEYTFDYEPFYVGKGHEYQYLKHLKEAQNNKTIKGNKHKFYKIQKILKEGLKPIILKVENNLTEQQAFDLEIYLIWAIGRSDLKLGTLTNLTNGGEGVSGYKHNSSTKNKIKSKLIGKMIGEKNPFFNKKHSTQFKQKMKKDRTGTGNPNFGKITPTSVRSKIANSQRGELNHMFGKKLSDKKISEISDRSKGNEYNANYYEMVYPISGPVIKNLAKFSKQHHLSFYNISVNYKNRNNHAIIINKKTKKLYILKSQ